MYINRISFICKNKKNIIYIEIFAFFTIFNLYQILPYETKKTTYETDLEGH